MLNYKNFVVFSILIIGTYRSEAQKSIDTIPTIKSTINFTDSITLKYSSILNLLEKNKPLPSFILNECSIEIEMLPKQNSHLTTSFRWEILSKVSNKNALIRVYKNRYAKKKCSWAAKNLNDQFKNYSWSTLAMRRLRQIEKINLLHP